jgi:phosphoribosylamine--glycine ligase
MQKLLPEFTPFFQIIKSSEDIYDAIEKFKEKKLQIVVKPQGLTGGKGVKVMGEHLKNYQEVIDYINQLLDAKDEVLLVEKLVGIEFTIMGITDGINIFPAPATYDYPFRYNNDKGAGTGGMGCFTDKNKYLPFMDMSDYDDCVVIMQKIINYLADNNIHFNGVINGGFFLTKEGIKFMEFNGRFGDPEAINILSILDSSFSEILKSIFHKNLTQDKVKFIKKSSVVKYLVSPNYPKKGDQITFSILKDHIEKEDAAICFSSAIQDGENYKTVSSSRVLAISYIADDIILATNKINELIEKFCSKKLDYRSDIGSKEDIEKLINSVNLAKN